MRKKLLAVILCASMLFPASVSAEVLGYEATLDTYTKEKKIMSSNNKSNEIIDLISEIIINFICESKSNNKSRQ